MTQTTITPSDYRWNLRALGTEIIFFAMAFTLFDPGSVLPAFARRLTESKVLIGLAGTVWTAGWTLPQLVAANTFGRDPRNKPYLRVAIMGRVFLWMIPAGLWLGLANRPGWMLVVFFTCMALYAAFDGIGAVSWFDFMAREIPANRRGRLLGVGQFIGGLASVAIGALISLILVRLPFPRSYALIFTLGALAFIPGGIGILLLREHLPQDAAAERAAHMAAGGWLRPLQRDPAFRRLIACRILFGTTALASSFYVGHAADVLHLPEHIIGQFVVAQTVTRLIGGPLFGQIHDRWGAHHVIRVGILLTALGPAFALTSHVLATPWLGQLYPLVFVALGISNAAFIIGFANYVMAMAPERVRPAYIGLSNTIGGLMSVWPLVGGWLLTTTSYTVLFALTTGLTALAFAFSFRLRPASACQARADERA